MKSVRFFLLSAAVVASSSSICAQALPTATRNPIQLGVAASFASPDTGGSDAYIKGFTLFGDFGLTRRFAVEADFHDLSFFTPADIGENTFLAGPRYSISLEGRANIYVKALGGIGRFEFQATHYTPRASSYGVFAPGGGIEFRASRHINVRAIDFEYQMWPGFPPHGLSPFVTSVGVAYIR